MKKSVNVDNIYDIIPVPGTSMRWIILANGAKILVGEAEELRPVYKSIARNSRRAESNFYSWHGWNRIFRTGCIYGILFDDAVYVLDSDTVMRYMFSPFAM